jgi:hypothetical protein
MAMNRDAEYATELTPAERATLERLVQAQHRSWRMPVAAGVLTVLALVGVFLVKPGRPEPPPEPSAFAQLAASAPRQSPRPPKYELTQRTLEVTLTGTSGRCLAGAVTATILFAADSPIDKPLIAKATLDPAAVPAQLPSCDPQKTKPIALDRAVLLSGDLARQWEGMREKWSISSPGLGLPPYTDPRLKPQTSAGDAVAWWDGLAARLASPQLDPVQATDALREAAARADADGVAVVPDATTDVTGARVFTVRVPGGVELAFDPLTGALRQRTTSDGTRRHITVYER